MQEKPVEDSWTKPDILTALRAAKKQGDRASPKNRDEMMTFWQELHTRLHPTSVEEQTVGINDVVRQDALTNENTICPAPVRATGVSDFNEKEGANETTSTAV